MSTGPTMALIEREAAKAKVAEKILGASEFAEDMRQACYEAIDTAPAIAAAPVIYGRWEKDCTEEGRIIEYFCSVCGTSLDSHPRMHFCPNCGARMDGGEEHG